MIELTKSDLEEISRELALDIAETSLRVHTQTDWLTSDEGQRLLAVIEKVAQTKISEIIGGYCS